MGAKTIDNRLYAVWQNNHTRIRQAIGELIKGEKYEFRYFKNEYGTPDFDALTAFPDLDKNYSSDYLFPAFSSRLPDRRRSDISEVLKHYEMDTYDGFELLKKSGGRLPTDSLEFIEPIDLSEKLIKRQFNIAGVKYYYNKSREVICSLKPYDVLTYRMQPDNSHDPHAVQILNQDVLIGYIPVYFSEDVTKAIKSRRDVRICVLEVKPVINDSWHELIKAELTIN